jgi:hypothetical protein
LQESRVNRIFVEAAKKWAEDGIKIHGAKDLGWNSDLMVSTKKIVKKGENYFAEDFNLIW